MNGNEYQALSMRTNDGKSDERLTEKAMKSYVSTKMGCNDVSDGPVVGELMMGCLGMSGEVGEFNDIIKKWIFHEADLDQEHLKKELGDIMWYIALICNAFKWSLDDVMQTNVNKLMNRYPDGFDTDKANHRKSGDV